VKSKQISLEVPFLSFGRARGLDTKKISHLFLTGSL